MVNVQGDANGISGKGCTGACNAVNTTLTTDAQLQNQGEWLLGALGLAEKLRSPAAHCLKASPFICWARAAAPSILAGLSTELLGPWSLSLWCLLAFIGSKVIGLSIQPSRLMYPLSASARKKEEEEDACARVTREVWEGVLGGHTSLYVWLLCVAAVLTWPIKGSISVSGLASPSYLATKWCSVLPGRRSVNSDLSQKSLRQFVLQKAITRNESLRPLIFGPLRKSVRHESFPTVSVY